MNAKHTISINGQAYDAITGMPISGKALKPKQISKKPSVEPVKPRAPRQLAHHSTNIHQQTRKSLTLRRSHLATPQSKIPASTPKRRPVQVVAKSPMIVRFASHPEPLPKKRQPKMINDIGPMVRQPVSLPQKPARTPSREIKNQLIAKASQKIDQSLVSPVKSAKPKRKPLLSSISKRHLLTAGTAVLLLIGYIAYLNIPGISVRIAAAQSGVNAKYPDYNPDGYSFQGPVAFQQGEVELNFRSNGGGEGYTIRQKNSDWNSTAVLDNLVGKESMGEYEISSTGGVTVYTYGTRAAWTNGGVLYTISGDAPLNTDQLVHIASSM